MIVDTNDIISTAKIPPDNGIDYIVVLPFESGLKEGDRVVMREVGTTNVLVRTRDFSVHKLQDRNGDYVVVIPAGKVKYVEETNH